VCTKFVAYYRVSTAAKGKSGLEAQEAAVVAFLASKGEDARLLASFCEIESSKHADNRPQLALAMEHARLTGGTLLIAKLDRLSRHAHFLLGLQKAGVKFVAVDMPEANELVVGLTALIAQAERQMISARTTAALAAAKARGVKLGNTRGAAHLRGLGSAAGVASLKREAMARAEGLRATMRRSGQRAS
jgi:DNA invertase Pin-like site-specific DNA recombinase